MAHFSLAVRQILTAISQCYCVYLLRRPAAAPSPTHNHSPSLCDDLIRRGSGAEGNHGNGTRATSAVGSSSPFSVSCLPASSLQPLTRATRSHRQALRTVQPTSHPSGDNQAATDLAAFAPWPIQCERQPQSPPAATLKVINTYVDNLLITC